MNPARPTRAKARAAILHALLALVSTLVSLGIGIFLYCTARVHQAREKVPAMPIAKLAQEARIPEELYRSLGWYSRDSRGAEFKYTVMKPPGTVRIGTFGDSNTFGDEVSAGRDYPSQLETFFRRQGIRNIQVLNFGGSGFGCHQSFRLWEAHARAYDLDFVLIGPYCQHVHRDESFWYGAFQYPQAIYGRYVLDGAGLRFIDGPQGATLLDRFDSFFGIFSGLQYLRYDRNRPVILKDLEALGISGFGSPFYYTRLSSFEEQSRIYQRMTRRLLETYGQVNTLHVDPQLMSEIASSGPHSVAQAIPLIRGYPFWRKIHPSSAGYMNMALAHYAMLTGQPAIKQIEMSFFPEPVGEANHVESLEAFSAHELRIGKVRAGQFVHAVKFGTTDDPDFPVDFKKEHIAGLVGLSGKGGFFRHTLFLPIRGEHFESEPEIVLTRKSKRGMEKYSLGLAKRVVRGLPLYFLETEGIVQWPDDTDHREKLFWNRKAFEAMATAHFKDLQGEPAEWAVQVGSEARVSLETTHAGEWVELRPDQEWIMPRTGREDLIDLLALKRTGPLQLVLERGKAPLRFTLGEYREEESEIQYPRGELLKFVGCSGQRSAILKWGPGARPSCEVLPGQERSPHSETP